MDSGPIHFDLEPFDCIIFNYCFWGRCLSVSSDFHRRIVEFKGLKIAILQDEYEYFLWHEKTLIALGINTIITCVPEQYWGDVFRDDAFRKVTLINALTGYVPDNLLNLSQPKILENRKWYIGYRSRAVPYIFGNLTQEKVFIGKRMKQFCVANDIPHNIEVSEETRFYGAQWPEFIGNCRVVLGTESGSNVFDFDGSIKANIDDYMRVYPNADFMTVYNLFLKDVDGVIKMNQISPRIFEAIALKTGLVLFEGEYSNIIRPWEHYIPLRKDFKNIDEVLDIIKDTRKLNSIIERAYNDIILSEKYHYKTYIAKIDEHINYNIIISKGCHPIYGLIAWRNENQGLKGLRSQNLQLPTTIQLNFNDVIPDPWIEIKLNWSAIYRRLIKKYEFILYSTAGQKIQSTLMKHKFAYLLLRKILRFMTGRS